MVGSAIMLPLACLMPSPMRLAIGVRALPMSQGFRSRSIEGVTLLGGGVVRGELMAYSVGDVVFCGTLTTAGEYTFIGHPKGDKAGKVLVLAHSGEVGQEVDADECAPTGRSNPERGQFYRLRYFRNHPGGLEGNP